jgi:hypothetical protein
MNITIILKNNSSSNPWDRRAYETVINPLNLQGTVHTLHDFHYVGKYTNIYTADVLSGKKEIMGECYSNNY